jgi:hypothetical protein
MCERLVVLVTEDFSQASNRLVNPRHPSRDHGSEGVADDDSGGLVELEPT